MLGGAGADVGRDATTGWRNSGTDKDGDGWPPVRRCAAAVLGVAVEASCAASSSLPVLVFVGVEAELVAEDFAETSCAASLTVLVLVLAGVDDEVVAGARRWVAVGENPCAFALNLLLLDAKVRDRRCFFFFCLSLAAGLAGLEGATCCDKGTPLSSFSHCFA